MSIKIIIIVLILITLLTTLISCKSINDDNAVIQIWYYDYAAHMPMNWYSLALSQVIASAKTFCEKNEIPYEIVAYDEKTLTYNDYLLKRNIAASQGNMIIIEDARYLTDIAKHHADYSKLDNYSNLLNMYKDKYSIPLGVNYHVGIINNKVINYYGISTDKPLITYVDYLELKQEMKEKGAKFKFNQKEFSQMIEYHLNKRKDKKAFRTR